MRELFLQIVKKPAKIAKNKNPQNFSATLYFLCQFALDREKPAKIAKN